ncbi:MAG: PH domain-containing protein [Patescibacteria group bacterium]|mgnify:CR=1 FL=1
MYSRQHFPNQKPNEHVLMFLRRHWIAVVKIIGMSLCLAAVPVVFYINVLNFTNMFDSDTFTAIMILLASAFYLFVILYTFSNFVDYYLDVWIVTNQRIINIEQHGLFSRVISEKDLSRMQDITSEVKGFLGTLLDYGDVHIQTAGEVERFIFKQIPFADEAARRISNLVSEYRKMNKTEVPE